MLFQKLQAWQDAHGVTDTFLAEQIGVHQTTLGRSKRGERRLPMKAKLKLQRITGIPPAEWAEFEAMVVQAEEAAEARAQKKSRTAEAAA